MTDRRMTIGEVAEATDVNVSAIRYYEKRGLIPEVQRFESSGYRAFPPETVRRIRFIKHAQSLGFTLDEIDDLLRLRSSDDSRCADARAIAERKLEEVDEKIEKLVEIREGLRSLTEICPGDQTLTGDCPILEVLEPETFP